MSRLRRAARRVLPAKVIYLWEKYGIKRIELFDGREDMDNKPEIPRDTDKFPLIPTQSSARKKWEEITDKKENGKHGKGN